MSLLNQLNLLNWLKTNPLFSVTGMATALLCSISISHAATVNDVAATGAAEADVADSIADDLLNTMSLRLPARLQAVVPRPALLPKRQPQPPLKPEPESETEPKPKPATVSVDNTAANNPSAKPNANIPPPQNVKIVTPQEWRRLKGVVVEEGFKLGRNVKQTSSDATSQSLSGGDKANTQNDMAPQVGENRMGENKTGMSKMGAKNAEQTSTAVATQPPAKKAAEPVTAVVAEPKVSCDNTAAVWANMQAETGSADEVDDGAEYDRDTTTLTVGYDIDTNSLFGGSCGANRVGVFGAFTTSDVEIEDGSDVDVDSTNLGLYTSMQRGDLYLNLLGMLVDNRSDYSNAGASADADSDGVTLGLVFGWQAALNKRWSADVALQTVYTNIDADSFTDNAGLSVGSVETDTLRYGINGGIAYANTNANNITNSFYAKLTVGQNDSETQVTVNTGSAELDVRETVVGVRTGGAIGLSKSLRLNGSVYGEFGETTDRVGVQAGVEYQF